MNPEQLVEQALKLLKTFGVENQYQIIPSLRNPRCVESR
jgi:hypothetical protein